MVEVYHAKKRRGIAGQPGKSTRAGEPKPYWPGLEMDEDGTVNADGGSSSNPDTKSDGVSNEGGTNSRPAIAEDVTEESMATEENKPDNSGASPPTEDSNTKRATSDPSTFRSRKRRRKVTANHGESKMDSLSVTPKNHGMAEGEREQQSETAKLPTVERAPATTAQDSIEEYSQPKITTLQDSTQHKPDTQETARTVDAQNDANRSNSVQSKNAKSESQSSVSSSGTKPSGATPRVLVNHLIQNKIPFLQNVVSDIRGVLLAMVSRSPALLQKYHAEIVCASSQPQSSQVSTAGSDNNNAKSQGTINHAGVMPPTDESMSKFLEICKRQETMMDRLDKKELDIEKREELLSKQIQQHTKTLQHEQNQDQNHQEVLSLRKELERANRSIESYRSKLEEKDKTIENLDESKRLVQNIYKSRVKEQFRVIEEKEQALKAERAENELLRKRLALLERGEHDETASNDSSQREHQAYSHRVRHRQSNGQRQKNLCSLQSSNTSPRNSMARDEMAASSPTSPAYNPRIRRFHE